MYERPRPLRAGLPANLPEPDKWQRWKMAPVAPEPVENEPAIASIDADITGAEDHQAQQELELANLRAQARDEGRAEGFQQGQKEGLEAGQAQGYEAGYEQGLTEGRAAIDQEVAFLQKLISQCESEVAQLQSELGQAIIHLGVRIAESVLGYELAKPQASIAATVKQILEQHDDAEGVLTLRLHPTDAKLVQNDFAQLHPTANVRFIADDSLERGDVKMRSIFGEVDATIQSRWDNALAGIGYKRPLARRAKTSST